MQIQLLSQASVIIRCTDCEILTDPWFHSKAFNDSWGLYPPASYHPELLETVNFLWISHEHPDHFHVPTLKSLPAEFKERVTVLFQQNNSDKVFAALEKFGFKKFVSLPHRKIVALTGETNVYCCQIGNMDSCLGVQNAGQTVLNLNDCEANTADCRMLLKDLGRVDVLLNQFSLAGYSGEADREKYLRGLARSVLNNFCENHHDLQAQVTIPMASYVYFSCDDNRYVNDYITTVNAAHAAMQAQQQACAVLYCGDTYTVGEPYDSAPALERFAEAYRRLPEQPFDVPQLVPLQEIEAAFHVKAQHFRSKFPRLLLRKLKPIVCRIADLEQTVKFSLADLSFELVQEEPDVTINSQPLHFMFKWPYGLQTLGVSARYILHKNEANWRRLRIICSLDNAELYLKLRYLFSWRNMKWAWQRLPGAWNQLRYQLKRMRPVSAE